MSLSLLDKIEGAHVIAGRTRSSLYSLVAPWWEGKSLTEIEPEFLRAFHSSMAHGDINYGFLAPMAHLFCGLMRGAPIDALLSEFETYVGQMDEYGIDSTKSFTLVYWRITRELTGKGVFTTKDDTLDVTRLYNEFVSNPQSDFVIAADCQFQMILKLLLGDVGDRLEEDERMMAFLMKYPAASFTYFSRGLFELGIALASLKLQEKTGLWKYKRCNRRILSSLKNLYKKKVPLMMGSYLLLLAESMVQRPKRNSWDSIQAAYRTA